jgi:hypothetical protein
MVELAGTSGMEELVGTMGRAGAWRHREVRLQVLLAQGDPRDHRMPVYIYEWSVHSDAHTDPNSLKSTGTFLRSSYR